MTEAQQATEVTPTASKEKNPFEFRRCTECAVEIVHGYLWYVEPKEPERVPVTIVSMRAIRWMLNEMEISDAHKAELLTQATVVGLVEKMEGDIQSSEYQLNRHLLVAQLLSDLSPVL